MDTENVGVGSRVEHERYGEGVISAVNLSTYEIFFERGGKMEISKHNDELEITDVVNNDGGGHRAAGTGIRLEDLRQVIVDTLDQFGHLQEVVELGDRWHGGTMILKPANEELQSKEVPIETFFHKIVMMRDRMRVLEQHINANKNMSDEEKVDLQQYITRCYGSFTTFNILFKDKDQQFSSKG
ncbi:MAG: hypothetical protein J4F31_03970 [Flavobacteriales bacterium]|nr:hypothetical protein [Flavobacteriales bacterium]